MVALLPLLLIPVVVTGFFLVYALVGWVLEGEALSRWQAEAMQVALLTALAQVFACFCIFVFSRIKRLSWRHLLTWSGPVHILFAIALAFAVYWRA